MYSVSCQSRHSVYGLVLVYSFLATFWLSSVKLTPILIERLLWYMGRFWCSVLLLSICIPADDVLPYYRRFSLLAKSTSLGLSNYQSNIIAGSIFSGRLFCAAREVIRFVGSVFLPPIYEGDCHLAAELISWRPLSLQDFSIGRLGHIFKRIDGFWLLFHLWSVHRTS